MVLLAIETATPVCGVALLRDGRTLMERSLDVGKVHAERLAVMVNDGLAEVSLAPSDVEAVAVSCGPGSFTGLRIGLSFAKGFVLAGDAGLVLVPTLEGLAAHVAVCDRNVCAILRARRGEFYAAVYVVGAAGSLREIAGAAVVRDEELAAFCPRGCVVVGQTDQLSDEVAAALRYEREAVIVPAERCAARASLIGWLGMDRVRRGEWADIDTAEPFYLQEFVARRPETIHAEDTGSRSR